MVPNTSNNTSSAATPLALPQIADCGTADEAPTPSFVSRTSFMCMCVRGAIRNLQEKRGKKSYMNDDAGRPLTRLQAIDALMDELTKGHETIPMGSKCGNPCTNAGCVGFDCGEHGGCPGYPTESASEARS